MSSSNRGRKEAKKRTLTEAFTPKRSSRLAAVEQRRLEVARSKFPEELTHFGEDFTKDVEEAMQSGGKLEKEHRADIDRRFKRARMSGPTLESVVPKPFMPELERRFKEGGVFQTDMRSGHKAKESYEGSMFTSTFVNPPAAGGGEKEIPRPGSPRPAHLGSGEAHQAHTAPYSVGGPATNDTRTVWAPQWANIGIDSRVEKGAIQMHQASKPTVHFRFDTAGRSTVGAVSKTKSGFSATAVQYRRRPEGSSGKK